MVNTSTTHAADNVHTWLACPRYTQLRGTGQTQALLPDGLRLLPHPLGTQHGHFWLRHPSALCHSVPDRTGLPHALVNQGCLATWGLSSQGTMHSELHLPELLSQTPVQLGPTPWEHLPTLLNKSPFLSASACHVKIASPGGGMPRAFEARSVSASRAGRGHAGPSAWSACFSVPEALSHLHSAGHRLSGPPAATLCPTPSSWNRRFDSRVVRDCG